MLEHGAHALVVLEFFCGNRGDEFGVSGAEVVGRDGDGCVLGGGEVVEEVGNCDGLSGLGGVLRFVSSECGS